MLSVPQYLFYNWDLINPSHLSICSGHIRFTVSDIHRHVHFQSFFKIISKLCLPVHASLAGLTCVPVWPTPKARKYKRSCNMQWLKQLGALRPYINNSNKSLPTEKCLLSTFLKAVNYSTLKGQDCPVKREYI